MSETNDERIRRLFAQSEPVAAEESFVAAVSLQVSARRGRQRFRRVAFAALFAVVVAVAAIWLAPYAPVALPDEIAETAKMGVRSIPFYLYLVLGAAVVPLAGTAWLVRRS